MSDPILGKIVVDFSQKYVSVYLCEGDGTVKDGDHFRWPYRLDVKEARQETRDCFDWFYDFCNDTVNGLADELQDGGGGGADSGQEVPAMSYEMTPEEAAKYGAGLSIWDQLRLLQAWAPLIGYGQRLVNEMDPHRRALVVADACEWLAAKTSSPLDDQLVRHIGDVMKTKEGEALLRWCLLQVEGAK